MSRVAFLALTGPAFTISPPEHAKESSRRVRIHRVSQKTLYPIREKQHASAEAWRKFIARAERDGVTIGHLFRALIHDYGDGKTMLQLPPTPPAKTEQKP
jgi:hypothetical protein